MIKHFDAHFTSPPGPVF